MRWVGVLEVHLQWKRHASKTIGVTDSQSESTFLSQKTYLTTYIDGDFEINGQLQRRVHEDEVDFSPRLTNKYILKTSYDTTPITIELVDFIGGAEEDIVPTDDGEYYLKIVEAGDGAPHNHFLKLGEVSSIHNVLYALNKPTDGAINITYSETELTIQSPYEGEYMTMATRVQGRMQVKPTNKTETQVCPCK